MKPIIVLENPARWNLRIPGARVVSARSYLVDDEFAAPRSGKVFNLCRSYAYQSAGYYVSLLATARGHRPLPTLATLQDLRQPPLVRLVSEDLEDLVQSSLARLRSERFQLSIYFGRNLAQRYDRLSRALFNQFPAPLLRAEFVRRKRWELERVRAIATAEIPESHRPFVIEQAQRYFRRPRSGRTAAPARFDLALLVNAEEEDAPSNPRAIRRFLGAARRAGFRAETIDRNDYGRIAEFDALFIRETTSVHHHTYRFSRRADSEGLIVIDDPESIIRCTNKVFLAEVFRRHRIPCPRTWIANNQNAEEIAAEAGFPCVVKRPDSSFSKGVEKANDERELRALLDTFLRDSELAVVQEFVPSSFDWRIGVLGGAPLYACRYYMARGQWKIQVSSESGRRLYGHADTLPVSEAPRRAVSVARRAARLMGNGFYGVDIKQVGRRFLVMEVNDNPSVDAGCEDLVLGDALYDAVMAEFLRRLEARGGRRP